MQSQPVSMIGFALKVCVCMNKLTNRVLHTIFVGVCDVLRGITRRLFFRRRVSLLFFHIFCSLKCIYFSIDIIVSKHINVVHLFF